MNTAVRNFILLINTQSNEERMKRQQMELGSGGMPTTLPCSITEGFEDDQEQTYEEEVIELQQDYYESIRLM